MKPLHFNLTTKPTLRNRLPEKTYSPLFLDVINIDIQGVVAFVRDRVDFSLYCKYKRKK